MTEKVKFENEEEKDLVIQVLIGAREEYTERGVKWASGILLGNEDGEDVPTSRLCGDNPTMGDVYCTCLSGSVLMGANRKTLNRGMLDTIVPWDHLDECYGEGSASLHEASYKALLALAWVINNDCPIEWREEHEERLMSLIYDPYVDADGKKPDGPMEISVVAFNDSVLDNQVEEVIVRDIVKFVISNAILYAKSWEVGDGDNAGE